MSATSTTNLASEPSFVVENERNLDRVFRPEQSDLELGDHYMKTGATSWSQRTTPMAMAMPAEQAMAAYYMGMGA